MCWTVCARAQTGLMRGSLLLSYGIVQFLSSFFWSSNIQDALSALMRLGSVWDSSLVPEKKRMFLSLQSFVFCSPFVLTYSHDLHAQKKAEMDNSASAFCFCVVERLYKCL